MLINIFNEHKERLPLSDCIYMAVMEKLKITKIVSFDEHFDLNKNIQRID
jgi:predicted nucleic acid-binding protein